MELDKDRLLYLIKEEIEKYDKELDKKLSMYTAKLSQLREEKSQEYLLEEHDFAEEKEKLAELRVLDKVLEDLNSILNNEEIY